MKLVTYVELDTPTWIPESPEAIVTWRWTTPASYLPDGVDAIPSLKSVSFSPARISLGANLGERAVLTATFKDHRHIFDTEAFDSGTFWGKWRARYTTRLRGRALRWTQGASQLDSSLWTTMHFIVDSVSGPAADGTYTIVAKDPLKLADSDRAQAPMLSTGSMVAGIDSDDGSLILTPSGIGDYEYPASGYVALGGTEICSFNREGDIVYLGRGALNSTASEHESGERVQLVLTYSAQDPADIIADLLTEYAGVDWDSIPITTWQAETGAFLQTLYTAVIAEPTSVNTLVSEIIEQAALALWWDPIEELIKLRVLRTLTTGAADFSNLNIMQGSLSIKEQPGMRLSQVWTYFGQRDFLKNVEQPDNFRSVAVTADLEAEAEYGGAVIKKIYSRWIPFGARSVATRLNALLLSRYVDPPRSCTFKLWRYGADYPILGSAYHVAAWPLQNIDGSASDMPIQITRLNPANESFEIEADEMLSASIASVDLTDRVIIIDGAINNINLTTLHDSIYPAITGDESPPINVSVYIEENVIVGSAGTWEAAFVVDGSWNPAVVPTIYVRGRIEGAGGMGGDGAGGGSWGHSGGTALYVRRAVTLVLNEGVGQIWGGGGGGGAGFVGGTGGGGGGGAGQIGGAGGAGAVRASEPGTANYGGRGGFFAGDGGGPGEPGFYGSGAIPGGPAGSAIDGIGYVSKIGTGNIRWAEV
jgi:hypothetical protein